MLLKGSLKRHPELDFAEARRVYELSGYEGKCEGELITSPHDLFCVETLRDRHGLRMGRALPADVFVFGKGEPPRPGCTQVGGVPFWPIDRDWPTGRDGTPLRFLAQFNFEDSRDLLAELPADLLLLFVGGVGEDWLWEEDPVGIHLEWVDSRAVRPHDIGRSVMAVEGGPYFGAVYRSADYPEAIEWANELDVGQIYNLPILNGTKIGGMPHFIQDVGELPGQFLCQLGSIQAAPFAPYPWVNQPDPLGLGFDGSGIFSKDNQLVFGDMGSIYVYREPDGRVCCSFSCY